MVKTFIRGNQFWSWFLRTSFRRTYSSGNWLGGDRILSSSPFPLWTRTAVRMSMGIYTLHLVLHPHAYIITSFTCVLFYHRNTFRMICNELTSLHFRLHHLRVGIMLRLMRSREFTNSSQLIFLSLFSSNSSIITINFGVKQYSQLPLPKVQIHK